jgi:hypothetical protein
LPAVVGPTDFKSREDEYRRPAILTAMISRQSPIATHLQLQR